MDAQFWIYVVIGAIYFLSRMLKKPEAVPGEQRRERRDGGPEDEEPQPMTFEELLREITEGKQARKPAPRPEPKPEPATRYEPYERDPGEEARSLERVDVNEVDDAQIFQKYQEAQSLANERKSLEETLRLEDTVVDFGRFAAFEKKEQKNAANDYRKIIRNPETLKQAVVMSEILKRKF